jgi:hypothetical protein
MASEPKTARSKGKERALKKILPQETNAKTCRFQQK